MEVELATEDWRWKQNKESLDYDLMNFSEDSVDAKLMVLQLWNGRLCFFSEGERIDRSFTYQTELISLT